MVEEGCAQGQAKAPPVNQTKRYVMPVHGDHRERDRPAFAVLSFEVFPFRIRTPRQDPEALATRTRPAGQTLLEAAMAQQVAPRFQTS